MTSCTPVKRSDLAVREVEGELLILDQRGGRIHKFNHSAGLVWEFCDGSHSTEQIISRVAQEYGVPIETVRGDVVGTIANLVELGLLENE